MTDPAQSQAPISEKPFYGYKNAGLLAFVYMCATGLVTYGFTVIFPIMIRTMGWGRGNASVASSIARLISGFLAPMAAFFINKLGSRKTIIIGLIWLLIGLLLLATVTSQLWHWFVIYGALIPIARILCGGLPVQVSVISWFNRKRATILGIVLTSAPVSGAIAQPIYTRIMQITESWRIGWLISGGFVLLALIASFWIRSKPSDLGQFPDGIAPGTGTVTGGKKHADLRTYRTPDTWTVGEAFRTWKLWLYIIVSMLQSFPLSLINMHGVLHLTDVGYSAMQAGIVLSVITFSSGVARFPMGWVGDRIEPRRIITIALCCMMVGFIGFWKAPSLPLLLVSGPFIGFCTGTMLVLMPAILSNYFGQEPFASIRGYMGPPRTILTAGFPPAAGYIADFYGSYNSVFLVLTVCLVVSIVGSIFLTPPKKPAKQNNT